MGSLLNKATNIFTCFINVIIAFVINGNFSFPKLPSLKPLSLCDSYCCEVWISNSDFEGTAKPDSEQMGNEQ